MKRLDFIKNIFGATALTIIPFKSDASKIKKYKFDDIFNVWPKNDMLVYFNPEHEIYKKLKSSIEERILDKKRFIHYFPVRDIYIPVKEYYTMDDFIPLILYLTAYYSEFNYFCEYEQDVFIRLTREQADRFTVTMFGARKQ